MRYSIKMCIEDIRPRKVFCKVWLGFFCKGVARSFSVFERFNRCKFNYSICWSWNVSNAVNCNVCWSCYSFCWSWNASNAVNYGLCWSWNGSNAVNHSVCWFWIVSKALDYSICRSWNASHVVKYNIFCLGAFKRCILQRLLVLEHFQYCKALRAGIYTTCCSCDSPLLQLAPGFLELGGRIRLKRKHGASNLLAS